MLRATRDPLTSAPTLLVEQTDVTRRWEAEARAIGLLGARTSRA